MSLLGDTSKLEYSDSVFRSPGRDPAGGKSYGTRVGVPLNTDKKGELRLSSSLLQVSWSANYLGPKNAKICDIQAIGT